MFERVRVVHHYVRAPSAVTAATTAVHAQRPSFLETPLRDEAPHRFRAFDLFLAGYTIGHDIAMNAWPAAALRPTEALQTLRFRITHLPGKFTLRAGSRGKIMRQLQSLLHTRRVWMT